MRWLGVGLIAVALITLGIAWQTVRSDAEERRIAAAQASYTQGTCTITDSEVIDWRHETKDDTTRGSTIETTLVVHAPTGDVRDVTYRYSDTYWNPASARNALESTHKRGATITCFFDAKNPESAVLIRRGMPAEMTNNPWLVGGLMAGLFFACGLVFLFVKQDGRKRIED